MRSPDLWLSDLRHGVRSLARAKAFSVTSLLIFALCLGANVALFAIVNAVLIRPLPFPHSEQLVTVYNSYPKAGVDRAGSSVPHYLERRAGIAAFAESGAFRDTGHTVGEQGAPERVEAMAATPSLFRALAVPAALGRTFTEEEGEEGKDKVLVLSDALWRSKFAADPRVIGRTVRIDGGVLATIVGVMPPGFRILNSKAQLWTPQVFSKEARATDERHSNNLTMIARLKPGATPAIAQAQVDALNASTAATDPYAKIVADAGFNTKVVDLHEDLVAKTRPMVLLLQAGVFLLLLIGLVNLTNLFLVRATGRTKELSVRQVLGANSWQLGRQILAETLILSAVGGVLGLGIGWAGLHAVNGLGADQLPRSGELTLDTTVCAVALGLSLVLGVVLAAPVLWQFRRANLAGALSVESRGGTTSRRTHRLRHTLIAAQFALAFVLLVSAGLLALSFKRVLGVNPGFQADHVFTATVPLPRVRYGDTKQRVAFVQRLEHELQGTPGLIAFGCGSALPFSGGTDMNAVTVVGHTPKPGESLKAHYMSGVTGNYFAALGIPLRDGRFLTSDDTAKGTRVCVVDEAVAQYYWPRGGALGGQLYKGLPEKGEQPITVVGIVGAVKQNDLADQRAMGAIYLPFEEYAGPDVSVAMRMALDPRVAAPLLRAAVLRIDPDVAVTDPKTLSARIDDSLEQRRSPMWLATIFAGLALVLVSVGLYGVLAYAVSQRRREIGVRMALGARPADIRTQFLGLGARLACGGAIIGALGAWWSSRAMQSLLFGAGAGQPAVFGVTLVVLATIALLACFLPASRAARVPPTEALRAD